MKIQGVLSALKRLNDFANFGVVQDNGQTFPIQAPASLLQGYKEGDRVEVEGELPPDPPFIASSIHRLEPKAPKPVVPWQWIAGMAGLLLLIVIAWVALRPKPAPALITPMTATKPEVSQAAVPPPGRLHLMNFHSGLCLSPAGGVSDNGAGMVQYLCDSDPSRFWKLQVVSNEIVKVMNDKSSLCLAVPGGSAALNAVTVQQTCDENPIVQWRYSLVSGSIIRLVNVHSGLCLTIAGGVSDRNAVSVQYTCDGDPARDWQTTP